jgi:hypothetical protein
MAATISVDPARAPGASIGRVSANFQSAVRNRSKKLKMIPMRRPTNLQWWWLTLAAVFIVAAWPPNDGKSLAMKAVNWAMDPRSELPVLPPQLGFGAGDDVDAVNARDAVVRQYDALYMQGGWTRRRLLLKVADDPFEPSTTRQLLTGLGVLSALIAWRFMGHR